MLESSVGFREEITRSLFRNYIYIVLSFGKKPGRLVRMGHSKLSDNILYLVHDLELMNLSVMFLDKNDLYLTFKFKMVTGNTQIKACFMHLNYIYTIKNSTCLMVIQNIDRTIRPIRLQCIRNSA